MLEKKIIQKFQNTIFSIRIDFYRSFCISYIWMDKNYETMLCLINVREEI